MESSIGFIGLGMMGAPMAKRLLSTGRPLFVYNRTRDKAESLLALGARWCVDPSAVASQSEFVFSMVSNSDVLSEISLGSGGVLQGLRPGGIHIDMSTVSPTVTRELAERYRARSCVFFHSPVLGSVPQATEGSLLLFVGGDAESYGRVEPLLQVLGNHIWRFERAEQASHMKLLCNLFIAGMISTLAQALVFAREANVDGQTLLEILTHSQLNSPMYQTKGRSILAGNFTPRFFLEHMLKDINLMLDAAKAVGAPLPAIQAAQQLFTQANESGFGREDYSAVVKILEQMARK